MNTSKMIFLLIQLAFSIGSFIIAYLQFKEKGFVFNNAYIFSSKEERKKLDFKPYYRQSAIIFTGIGFNFLLLASDIIFHSKWLIFASIGLMILLVGYALVSTVKMMTKSK